MGSSRIGIVEHYYTDLVRVEPWFCTLGIAVHEIQPSDRRMDSSEGSVRPSDPIGTKP